MKLRHALGVSWNHEVIKLEPFAHMILGLSHILSTTVQSSERVCIEDPPRYEDGR